MKAKSPPAQPLAQDEPHQIKVIRLTKADHAELKAMAARHRVTNLMHFIDPISAVQSIPI